MIICSSCNEEIKDKPKYVIQTRKRYHDRCYKELQNRLNGRVSKCNRCDGTGIIVKDLDPNDVVSVKTVYCEACHGYGAVGKNRD